MKPRRVKFYQREIVQIFNPGSKPKSGNLGESLAYLGQPPVGRGEWCGPADTGPTAMPLYDYEPATPAHDRVRPHEPVSLMQLDPLAKEDAQYAS